MKTISLTQGKVVIVDDENYESLNCFKWHVLKGANTYYAIRNDRGSDFKKKSILMHRIILNAPDGVLTDHRNGDGLDNRKLNLRLCTHAENIRHQGLNRRNTSGFKGVIFRKSSTQKAYDAKIKVNNKWIHLGCYRTAKQAAQAYDLAALKYHEGFALTNQMLGLF